MLKKKHSSRRVGGAERVHDKEAAGGQGQVAAGRVGGPTFACR